MNRYFYLITLLLGLNSALLFGQRTGMPGSVATAVGSIDGVIVRLGPDTLAIGRTLVGTCDTMRFTIRNNESQEIVIDGIDLLAPPTLKYLSPTISDEFNLAPGEERELSIGFCPLDSSCIRGQLEIVGYRVPEGPSDGRITQTITVNACGGQPVLALAPATLEAGIVAIGESSEQTVQIYNRGNLPLRVDSVTGNNPIFSYALDRATPFGLAAGDSATITVQFSPVAEGEASGKITIYGNDPISASRSVTLRGIGVERRLTGPSNVDVGKVLGGRCFDTVIVVKNVSPLTTVITAYYITASPRSFAGDGFSVVSPPSLPLTLGPGESLELTIRFCAFNEWHSGNAELWIEQESGDGISISLEGYGRGPNVYTSIFGFNLDFGSTVVGRCRDTAFWLNNREFVDLQLRSFDLDRRYGPGSIEVIEPKALPLNLRRRDSVRVVLRFCPGDTSNSSWKFRADFDAGGTYYPLYLYGEGIVPQIWLDTTSMEAGSTGELFLRVWPTDLLDKGTISVDLQMNRDALFVTGVEPVVGSADPTLFTYTTTRTGDVRIESDSPVYANERGEILSVRFRGLITGEEINRVRFTRFAVADSVLRWDTLEGVIHMSGCDVGTFTGTSRTIAVSSLQPNPATTQATLLYRAPEGIIPQVTLYDYRGGIVRRFDLPVGTGFVDEFQIDLSTLSRGLYMLELLDRDERRYQPLYVE